MDPVREIVWEEVEKEYVEITQKGEVRSHAERKEIRGPIRVRRGLKWDEM